MLTLVILLACSPGSISTVGNATDGVGGDSADFDTDSDETSDSDAQTDTEEPPEPEYVTDFSGWTGTLSFFYDYSDYGLYCDDVTEESAALVAEGTTAYDVLAAACPDCTHFYAVTPATSQMCDWISLPSSWRGIRFEDGDSAVVHYYVAYGEDLYELATIDGASFDGVQLRYEYDYDAGYGFIIDVTEAAAFQQVLVEE
jgi:hypothetical protein